MPTTRSPGFLKLVGVMLQAWRVRQRARRQADPVPVTEIRHPARRRTDVPATPAGPEAG